MGAKRKNSDELTPAKNVDANILLPRIIFIITTLILVLIGWIMVFSASSIEAINNDRSPYEYLLKQAAIGIAGILIAIAIWRFTKYSWWKTNVIWLLFLGLMFAMLATIFVGTQILGAKRWINLGFFSFQASEYAKIVLVLLVAKYYSDYKTGHVDRLRFIEIAGGATLILVGFIFFAQSDLGTSIICIVGVLAVLFFAGCPLRYFVPIVLLIIIAGMAAIFGIGWRSDRMVFLDPYNDGADGYGAGYQLIRSWYAFGQGGLGGLGLGNSFEKYQYLPEAETDFIFSIIGEELGLFGCVFVMAVFITFLISGLKISHHSKSIFTASTSSAFVIMIVFQAVINIGCVIGFLPTTGKPLPFISYGGSSVIASLIMVGLVLSASEEDAKPDVFQKRRESFRLGVNRNFVGRNNNADDQQKTASRSSNRTNASSRTRASLASNQKSSQRSKGPKEPEFISANQKQRENRNKSFAYRRPKASPSFEARKSQIAGLTSKTRANGAKNSKITNRKKTNNKRSNSKARRTGRK